ncbi:MAG: hypothetical protein ABJB76_02100 [Candidatus Nitrosocosmicus sp.]
MITGNITGKMTATWLIIVVMVGCLLVPLMIIYFHSIHPYEILRSNTAHFILELTSTFLPNISIMNLITTGMLT